MSYHVWSEDGYGISTKGIELTTTVERIESLLEYAPVFRDDIHNYFKESDIEKPTVEDYLDFDQDYGHGAAYLLKEVIKEAENLELITAENFDCEHYILLSPTYPWGVVNDRYKAMTQEELDSIFKKYAAVLSDEEVRPDYESVPNGG